MGAIFQTFRNMMPAHWLSNTVSQVSVNAISVHGADRSHMSIRPTAIYDATHHTPIISSPAGDNEGLRGILSARPRVDVNGVALHYKIEDYPETYEGWAALYPDLIAQAIEEGKAGKVSSYTKESLERIRGHLTVSLDEKIVLCPANLAQLEALAPEIVAQARDKGRRESTVKQTSVVTSEKVTSSTNAIKNEILSPKPPLTVIKEAPAQTPLSLEERCKIDWDKSPELRKEFSWCADPFKVYVASEKALACGKSKILGGTVKRYTRAELVNSNKGE